MGHSSTGGLCSQAARSVRVRVSNEKTFHHLALSALLNGPFQLGFQPLVHLVASLALNSVMRSGPFGGLSHTWKWEEG